MWHSSAGLEATAHGRARMPAATIALAASNEFIELFLALRTERQTTFTIVTHSTELAARNAGFPAGRWRDIPVSCFSSGGFEQADPVVTGG